MEILVLYYSVGGSVKRMAELVASGVERVPGAASGPPCADHKDLQAGLADNHAITEAERTLCIAQGKRLAEVALKLVAR